MRGENSCGRTCRSDSQRNISTCVEKTTNIANSRAHGGKHLHMRGENIDFGSSEILAAETSPHAWRKPFIDCRKILQCRNISTCVEKTDSLLTTESCTWKHLHMRGENPINSSYCNSSTIYLDIILRYFCQKSKACHLLIQHNQVKNLFL